MNPDINAASVPSQCKAKKLKISDCKRADSSAFPSVDCKLQLPFKKSCTAFQKSRLCTVSFFPYPIKWTKRFRIPFVFRTISLQTAIVFNVFCHRWSFLLYRSYSRLLLIGLFTSRLLWPPLTSVHSVLPWVVVTPFRAYRTDLPGYHMFLPLHPSASFIMHDSVWLLGFDLDCNLTPMHNLVWDFCSSD